MRLSDGHERSVRILDPGDYFGEVALMESVPRTATVRACLPSTLLTLPREQFMRFVNSSPELKEAIVQGMQGLERNDAAPSEPAGCA